VKEHLNKTTVDEDEDEAIVEPTFQNFSFDFNEENISMMQQHAINQISHISKQHVENTLSNFIIRPWEEIRYNKNRT
jgi:hypothetical protein